ncbi:MAG: FtsX-like permease family protein, partial [Acidimicrobiia bacterium]|nr:FtsX-like permease family protein [Acidimicrobiia bacterium]
DPVFYLDLDRLQDAIEYPGISWIDLRVDDNSPAALAAAGDTVRDFLTEVDPEITYWTTLRSRAEGDWPEKDQVGNIVQLMYIIAALGLISALLMVYTTMNTVVREQTREIGIVKAVGGPRRAIVRSYLLTATILGGLGTAVGVAAGIFLSNLLVGFAGRQFSGIEPAFGIPPWVLALSIVVGISASIGAALPAILRATRVPVREALVDHGVTDAFGRSAVDEVLRRTPLLSRPARLGLRNAARRKARSLTTALQIGFAVGTFLGFLAMGIAVMDLSDQTYDGEGGDIQVSLNADAGTVIAGVPGVAAATPVVYSSAGVAGDSYALQGQTHDAARYHPDLLDGRWFDPSEESQAQRVAVAGPALAEIAGISVGDSIEVETSLATFSVEVVGVDSLMVNDGKTLFMPLSTTLELTERTVPQSYYVVTTDADEAFVDATTMSIQQALTAAEISAIVEARYIDRQANQSQNRLIIAILMILGLPVIAIGMIGLVNTMTMNVFERTREIGVLRSIGARARHIRRMIRAEALVVSVLGWLAAIPLGYLIATILIKLLSNSFDVTFAVRFPLWPLPLALIATLLIGTLVVLLPVRRAVRLRPGVALRYE